MIFFSKCNRCRNCGLNLGGLDFFVLGVAERGVRWGILRFINEAGFADVDVFLGEGVFEEGGPEIVDGVAEGHAENAFLVEAPGGGEHLQLESEDDGALFADAAGNIGVFAVESDAGVEAADGLESAAGDDEVAALDHGADTQEIAVDGVGAPRDEVVDADEDTLARGEVVIDDGAAEGGEAWMLSKVADDFVDPAGGEDGVCVDVGDEIAGAGVEAGLTGEGESFAGLVDNADARE